MYLGNQPALSYTSFAKQDFTTSATTAYTLSQPVANENEIALFINFVRQEPTTAYTASGTSLTLTSATSASDDMYAIFLGKAVQTVNPPAGSVDSSKINYPLTTFSSTGIDDNATSTAITINSSENVGIKTATPATELDISSGATTGGTKRFITLTSLNSSSSEVAYADVGTTFNQNSAGNESGGMDFRCSHNGSLANRYSFGGGAGDIHAWYTGTSTERMRIDSSGGLGVGDTPFATTRLTLKAPPSGNQYMVYGKNGAGTNVLIIAGDGSITNYYGSYGTISDENLKQNIVNANSQWNDIKSLQIKNYKLKSDVELNPETAPNLLGVIAQDLESSNMSGLVSVQNEVLWSEYDELPEGVNVGDIKEPSHKSVKYSVLYMKAVKALQEAMERIETLEAKVTALENN